MEMQNLSVVVAFFLIFQGKIEASEVVQSLKILGIDISIRQAEKILQRSATIISSQCLKSDCGVP